jgi:leader peptidase (prepilin peptidase) / N-methyltransferase
VDGTVAVVCAVLGLLVGSFLNVVVARVPAGESVVTPPSRCPGCGSPVAPRDNVPVLGWVLLRGRARCCGTRISARYPVVEAGTALAFGLTGSWVERNAGSPDWPLAGHGLPHPAAITALLAMLYLAGAGIALALIDIDTFRLPFWIVVPSWYMAGVLLPGAALLAGNRAAAVRALAGGLSLWLFFRLMHQLYQKGMGYGDVRLAGLLGGYLAWLGWDVLMVGAFAGFFVGALGGVAAILLRGAGLKSSIPYGPYMILGGWLGLVFGHSVAQAYLHGSGL